MEYINSLESGGTKKGGENSSLALWRDGDVGERLDYSANAPNSSSWLDADKVRACVLEPAGSEVDDADAGTGADADIKVDSEQEQRRPIAAAQTLAQITILLVDSTAVMKR